MFWRTSNRPSRLAGLVLLALLPAAAGCISMDVPEPFLVIDRGASELKAISPDEGMIWVKEFSDSLKGNLAFWTRVLKTDFVDNRGYTLLEEGTIQDGKGHEGTELRFEVTVDGAPQAYLVALFVHPGWLSNTICTAEYVDRKDQAEKRLEAVREAIGTLRL